MVTSCSQPSSTEQSFLHDFNFLTFLVGLLSSLILIPFSLKLSFTWVQMILWVITLFPILLAQFCRIKKSNFKNSLKPFLLSTFLLQLSLLVFLILGFFWDSTQIPTHLKSEGVLTLKPLVQTESDYIIETDTHYQILTAGKLGPRLFTYPKNKTILTYNAHLHQPTLETFTSCSHHWVETLVNRLLGLDEHLSLQKTYQLTFPATFQ